MSWSEFPVPCSTPTLRLAVPTCFAGGQGHSQVLVRFSSSMPHSLIPMESTRAHHIALFILASVTLTTSPSTFVHLTGLNRLRKCGLPYGLLDSLSTLRPESHQTVRKTRYWWVVSPYQIETFILSEPPSFAWRTNVLIFLTPRPLERRLLGSQVWYGYTIETLPPHPCRNIHVI